VLNRDKNQFTPNLMECSKPQQTLGLRVIPKKGLDAYVSTDCYPGHLFVSHPTILFPFRIALSKEHFPLITEKGSQVSDSSLFRLWHLDDTGFLLFVKGFYVRQVLVSIPGTVSGL
jgi:hypothetical protein